MAAVWCLATKHPPLWGASFTQKYYWLNQWWACEVMVYSVCLCSCEDELCAQRSSDRIVKHFQMFVWLLLLLWSLLVPVTQHPVREVSLLIFTGAERRHQLRRRGLEYSIKQSWNGKRRCLWCFIPLWQCILISPLVFISLFSGYCSTKYVTQCNYEPKTLGWLVRL